MNRRTAIRKVVGVGAAAAALPVLDTVASANRNYVYTGETAGMSPAGIAMQPPPPDTRTPEQVVEDQEREYLNYIMQHLTRQAGPWTRRSAHNVWNHEFEAALAEAHTRGITVETRVIGGFDSIIGPNGNIVRRLAQPVYFATQQS